MSRRGRVTLLGKGDPVSVLPAPPVAVAPPAAGAPPAPAPLPSMGAPSMPAFGVSLDAPPPAVCPVPAAPGVASVPAAPAAATTPAPDDPSPPGASVPDSLPQPIAAATKTNEANPSQTRCAMSARVSLATARRCQANRAAITFR